jgi:hypothetical protein
MRKITFGEPVLKVESLSVKFDYEGLSKLANVALDSKKLNNAGGQE